MPEQRQQCRGFRPRANDTIDPPRQLARPQAGCPPADRIRPQIPENFAGEPVRPHPKSGLGQSQQDLFHKLLGPSRWLRPQEQRGPTGRNLREIREAQLQALRRDPPDRLHPAGLTSEHDTVHTPGPQAVTGGRTSPNVSHPAVDIMAAPGVIVAFTVCTE